MKTAFGFAEILEYFDSENTANDCVSNTSTHATTSFHAGWESTLDPAGLAYIMGQTSIYTTVSTAKSPYKKYRANYQRPTHTFTDKQALAYADLSKWAPELKNNFNYKELKTNYRLALLKTHPDQGGSSENFWSVKKSYEVLCSLVKS